jgi:protein-S-isoprenylcysteine O-methyltransferase Ste14
VTAGPFAHIRHPIYLALFLSMLALAVAFGHPLHLLLSVPLYAMGTGLRVIEEERLLREMFGRAYDDYAATVRRFVPGIF